MTIPLNAAVGRSEEDSVRTVLVVCEGQIPWDDVKRLLGRANARVADCTLAQLGEAASRTNPDLVILGEEAHQAALSSFQRPRIVVFAGGKAEVTMPANSRPPLARVPWPIDEATFLEVTARMLRVSERRTFRALIRILPPGSSDWFLGRSEDFSLTGLAFHADRAFVPGDPLVVSLHLPGDEGAIQFDVVVTREAVDPHHRTAYYGARFVQLAPETRRKLQDFIVGAR